MTLRLGQDVSPADWIVHARLPGAQLACFGPAGFAAYARLRFIPDPTRPGQDEADADVSEDHPTDLEQTRRALDHLAPFTSTPDDCYFCLWDGWPGVEELSPPTGPWVSIPHRRYLLFRGALSDLDAADEYVPALVWPADRSWCFAKDVDPHWAGIGGSQAAIDTLLAADDLDVVAARPGEPQPVYYG